MDGLWPFSEPPLLHGTKPKWTTCNVMPKIHTSNLLQINMNRSHILSVYRYVFATLRSVFIWNWQNFMCTRIETRKCKAILL